MRKINRRIAMAAVALGALAAAQGARAEEVVRIGLAVPQNAAYVQFYAAEALGFFKEAGVKPEITIYRGGAASQEAMSAGAADMITYFGAGAGLAIAKGAKEKIVSVIDPTPHGWHMLVMANSPIKSPKELDGKKIGVATKAGTADMFALWAADAAGVKVQTIPVGGGGMVPALRSAQVEAIAMFPGASLSLVVSGEARSILDLGKEMLPTLPDVIVASDEFMAKKPEAVRGTLRALYRSARGQHRQRHGQVERRPLLAQVGRRQIDGDAPARPIEARVGHRRLHPVDRLANGHIGQAHQRGARQPLAAQIHLHLAGHRLDAPQRESMHSNTHARHGDGLNDYGVHTLPFFLQIDPAADNNSQSTHLSVHLFRINCRTRAWNWPIHRQE